MKKITLAILAAVVFTACSTVGSHLPKADDYRTNDPAIQQFLLHLRESHGTGELHSVMILKDGKKMLEYYDCCYGPDFMNICWSASKTFTATAVGFAVQDGLLNVEDRIIDHLKPEQMPSSVSDTLASLTLYDLLRMSSGLRLDPIGPTGACGIENPTKQVLEGGFIFSPGERFKYNSHNTYLLSVAVQNATGMTVANYINEKLFKPLDIRKYHWDISPEGYSMGGWGLYLPTESLAKMGQWMLQRGEWNGRQLLAKEWFDQAMSPQIYQGENGTVPESQNAPGYIDWFLGYGYQMWMSEHNGVRLDGAHGQWVVILPDQNAVIVVTGYSGRTKDEFAGVWEHLFPLVEE